MASELVEVTGVDVYSHAAAVDLHLIGSAAEVGLRGAVAVGIEFLAVDIGIELRSSCTHRAQDAALEGEFALAGSGESYVHVTRYLCREGEFRSTVDAKGGALTLSELWQVNLAGTADVEAYGLGT